MRHDQRTKRITGNYDFGGVGFFLSLKILLKSGDIIQFVVTHYFQLYITLRTEYIHKYNQTPGQCRE